MEWTSKKIFEKLTPARKDKFSSQLLEDGLNVNLSTMFSRFVKDAARCNGYNSDIFYDMKYIEKRMKEFNPEEEFEPIWVGFRKLGVDGTDYIIARCTDSNINSDLYSNYFALYSVSVEDRGEGFYDVILNEYAV